MERNGFCCRATTENGIAYLNVLMIGVKKTCGRIYMKNAKTIWIWTMFLSIVLSSKLTLFQQEPQAARVKPKALGLSVAGYTTKIHAVADAPGNPIDFILTEGQASDVNQALPLLELVPEVAQAFMADKAYDCNEVIEFVKKRKMIPVIPPKSNRVNPQTCDFVLYKERHLIECFFGKIKHYRRIFSRFEKKAKNYMGFLRFVSALIWLR